MSNAIDMSITIGGSLKASCIQEFLDTIQKEISEITEGPLTKSDLRAEAGKPIQWRGMSRYGLCDNLFAYCQKHKLTFQHYCSPSSEYDATSAFWKPGMKEPRTMASNANADTLVRVEAIKPICDLLLSLAEQGKAALPLFIGHDEYMDTLVELGAKNYKAMCKKIKKDLNDLLPDEETTPNFIIKG